MDWVKIPIDNLLYFDFTKEEMFTLIRYQALYCQLESEPTQSRLLCLFDKKEVRFINKHKEMVRELCEKQIKTVKTKRKKDKESYKLKQTLNTISEDEKITNTNRTSATDKIREDKNKKDNNKLLSQKETTTNIKKLSLIDEGWKPKPTTLAKMLEYGYSEGKTQIFVDNFIDKCIAKAYKYADFDRALLSWARKEMLETKGLSDATTIANTGTIGAIATSHSKDIGGGFGHPKTNANNQRRTNFDYVQAAVTRIVERSGIFSEAEEKYKPPAYEVDIIN